MIFDYVILKEIKPELSGYLAESLKLISKSPLPDDDAVHDIRVFMKKSRATLKLISPYMDEVSFKREYAVYREVGRLLSAWRDTSVQRKTLKSFKKLHSSLFAGLSGSELVTKILVKPDHGSGNISGMEQGVEEISGILKKAIYRLRFLTLSDLNPEVLLGQLEKTFLAVSAIYLKCRNNIKPERIHEFRKVAKDFLYQLSFFRSLNPAVIKKLEKNLDAMTQNLGKYNDLSQLVSSLDFKHDMGSNPALDELLILIRDRQDKHLNLVWPLAYKIFCPGRKLLNVLGYKLVVL